MADVIDVQNALAALAVQGLYPGGVGQPSAAGGIPCKVYPGWPTESQLDADLAQGIAHVTIFPGAAERNTSRYPRDWQQLSVTAPTIGVSISGQQITIGGAMPAPFAAHNVMAMVSGKPYVYAVQSGDTLAGIATALAALIAADIAGSSSAGPIITVGSAGRITAARVGVQGISMRELKRQERAFQITIWADTPAHRDSVGGIADVALSAANFLSMPDGSAARLIYKSSMISDALQKAKLYRRDLFYTVEYATTQIETDTQITQEQLNTSGSLDLVSSITPVTTSYQ